MIDLPPHRLPALVRWFPTGAPGSVALTEHVLTTEAGRWDRVVQPRVIAAECGDHVLLRGDPRALAPRELAVFADHNVEAPGRFGIVGVDEPAGSRCATLTPLLRPARAS
ncbi:MULTISPECIES: hypothetical protein [unclassified Streptomyces]|uniref:hypothetical protein n=1 Tax=unclassified Streptomyces TaxID=2593676 RepID=UPI0033306DC8